MLFKKRPGASDMKWRLIGLAGKLFIDVLLGGSRIEIRGRQPIEEILASRRFILAFWHARILLITYAHKRLGAAVLVSDSADGEIIARILQRQGQMTVRGSTSKGGTRALASMIKRMRTGHRPGGVVPDGPQGPREKVQPGVIFLAQKTGYPIVPVTYSAQQRKVFNSWDRFILPYPASPCILIYGNPIQVPGGSDPDQMQDCAQALEDELNRITIEADARFGHVIE
ncbi:MAG: DUF374 domain-containing protein [Desulfobacteraceae bacterium]|nr:MAG: DUF374 domain-containing protein [Desulfobacteraceae bacterium]